MRGRADHLWATRLRTARDGGELGPLTPNPHPNPNPNPNLNPYPNPNPNPNPSPNQVGSWDLGPKGRHGKIGIEPEWQQDYVQALLEAA